MANGTKTVDTVKFNLNDSIALRVMLTETKNGTDGWKYRREDTGKGLPNVTGSVFDALVEGGTLSYGDLTESFAEIIGTDDDGNEYVKRNKNGGRYAVARFYNIPIGGRRATITVKCNDVAGDGNYKWTVTGTFPTGGTKGRKSTPPTDDASAIGL